MSEKELLKALEQDTARECDAMLENAATQADAMLKDAAEAMERLKQERLAQAKADLALERMKKLTGAKLYGKEALLKARGLAAADVLDKAEKLLADMRARKNYAEVLKRFFQEALNQWPASMKDGKPLVIAARQDIRFLRNITDCEIVADETGDMPPGVILTNRDRRFKIINTLSSRMEKARQGLIAMIDRMLFENTNA